MVWSTHGNSGHIQLPNYSTSHILLSTSARDSKDIIIPFSKHSTTSGQGRHHRQALLLLIGSYTLSLGTILHGCSMSHNGCLLTQFETLTAQPHVHIYTTTVCFVLCDGVPQQNYAPTMLLSGYKLPKACYAVLGQLTIGQQLHPNYRQPELGHRRLNYSVEDAESSAWTKCVLMQLGFEPKT